MEQQRLANNLTDEELLQLVSNANKLDVVTKDESSDMKDLFLRFLANFNINPGKQETSLVSIQKLFKLWSHKHIKLSEIRSFGKAFLKIRNNFLLINHNQSYLSKLSFNILDSKTTNLDKSKLLDSIDKFLKDNDIKDGKRWVEISSLWDIYSGLHCNYKEFKVALSIFLKVKEEYVRVSKNVIKKKQ